MILQPTWLVPETDQKKLQSYVFLFKFCVAVHIQFFTVRIQ